MPWTINKKVIAEGFEDLRYLPKDRNGWNGTLSAVAFAVRRQLTQDTPNLNSWAVRHGALPSARYEELGHNALVLWHGTSVERAEKIAQHGLFHKKGVWATKDPFMAHSFTRGRSERFGSEGAMVCLVMDQSALVEGLHFNYDSLDQTIYRFHQCLPADAVEYVLTENGIHFNSGRRASLSPWPKARLKKVSGQWVPIQRTPVRYSDTEEYSSLKEFLMLQTNRLFDDFEELTAIEIFSVLYSSVIPWEALSHNEVFELIEEKCQPSHYRRKWHTLRKNG